MAAPCVHMFKFCIKSAFAYFMCQHIAKCKLSPGGAGLRVSVRSAWAGLAAGCLHTLSGPDHLAVCVFACCPAPPSVLQFVGNFPGAEC